jgi:hypothetical protein
MQGKAKKQKKAQKEIKVHDLKPSRDAKGGGRGPGHNVGHGGLGSNEPPDPC